LLHVREQVAVAATLLLSRVANPIVDDSVVHALAGQGRDERVPEDVSAFQNVPLRDPMLSHRGSRAAYREDERRKRHGVEAAGKFGEPGASGSPGIQS
jgi:hypothetical protein